MPPRILCIGQPVRDLTFRVRGLPEHGSKANVDHFDQICGGNSLNAAIGIVRLGGRASLCGPMGDVNEIASRYILEQMASEDIDTSHIVRVPGAVTPISAFMIDETGERTGVTYRDPKLWNVKLPPADLLLTDCDAVLIESRCAEFSTDLCAEAIQRGIPVIVDVDRAMSLRESLLTAATHVVFSSEPLQETAGCQDEGEALNRGTLPRLSRVHPRPPRHDLARRTWRVAANAGLPRTYRRHAGRGRHLPWRPCARDR
jgi:sulfofructose kinase